MHLKCTRKMNEKNLKKKYSSNNNNTVQLQRGRGHSVSFSRVHLRDAYMCVQQYCCSWLWRLRLADLSKKQIKLLKSTSRLPSIYYYRKKITTTKCSHEYTHEYSVHLMHNAVWQFDGQPFDCYIINK